MNKTEHETPFSENTIKFRPHIVYNYIFDLFNRPRRLLIGWHLFPFHPVYACKNLLVGTNLTVSFGRHLLLLIFMLDKTFLRNSYNVGLLQIG